MNDPMPDPELLAAVRDRMTKQAVQLESLLGGFWAAATFLGAGVTLATRCLGKDGAVKWLRDQADELEGSAAKQN